VVAVLLLATFVYWESRSAEPLMPLSIFRIQTVASANGVAVLLGAVVFANFFLLTLYVQDVLHYSALRTGITFLVTAGTTVIVAGIAQFLTTKFGPRPVLVGGMVLLTAGMLFYTQIPVDGRFVSNLLVGYLLVGVGLALAFVSVSIAALGGVGPKEAGLASGLINTSQQVGGALGVAIAGSVAVTHAKSLLQTGHSQSSALTSGYALGFWVIGGLAILGVLVALSMKHPEPASAPELLPAEG
jgi:MFS family permease